MSDAPSSDASNRHASGGAPTSEVVEPPFPERARTLVQRACFGTLATQSRRQPGFPFASIAPYGLDAAGCPTFLVSTMAVHTQNLLGDPRASLLIPDPEFTADPLAGGRVTLLGPVARVADAEVAAVREAYLSRHATARHWVDFDDFAFWRLDPTDCYFVAGFGAMGWVEAAAYRAATPDPLAEAAAGILRHMNADHADALVLYCRVFAGVAADAATMTAVDRLGFRVRARVGDRLQGIRLNYLDGAEAHTPEAARKALVAMVHAARARDVSA